MVLVPGCAGMDSATKQVKIAALKGHFVLIQQSGG